MPNFPCSVKIFCLFCPKLHSSAFIFVGGYKDKLGRFALVAKDALQKVNKNCALLEWFDRDCQNYHCQSEKLPKNEIPKHKIAKYKFAKYRITKHKIPKYKIAKVQKI